ncbi:hypothetical protein C8Q78DRAFT_991724 [Trametes maxima]|nr:hypothetical protein C8Q78DRAFT_991724 [Trametes maxima]
MSELYQFLDYSQCSGEDNLVPPTYAGRSPDTHIVTPMPQDIHNAYIPHSELLYPPFGLYPEGTPASVRSDLPPVNDDYGDLCVAPTLTMGSSLQPFQEHSGPAYGGLSSSLAYATQHDAGDDAIETPTGNKRRRTSSARRRRKQIHSPGSVKLVGPEDKTDDSLDTQHPGRVDFPVGSTSNPSRTRGRYPSMRPPHRRTDLSQKVRPSAVDAVATPPDQGAQALSTPLGLQAPVKRSSHMRELGKGASLRSNPVEEDEPTRTGETIGSASRRPSRQAFIKATRQILQLNAPSASRASESASRGGARRGTRGQRRTSPSFAEEDHADSTEDDEDDEFIPEPDPERERLRSPNVSQKSKSMTQRTRAKRKVSPRGGCRMHRKSSHTYVRGVETMKYSREADYKRYEIKKLHDGARCGFCHTKVSRLPDTAYRHLRDSCERFPDSDFYLENEQPDPEKPELSRAELAKMAVADRRMIVQLPCRNDADYKMRLKAIGSTPDKIERRLARYASIYKIGNCACCPHPSYSTYRPPSY